MFQKAMLKRGFFRVSCWEFMRLNELPGPVCPMATRVHVLPTRIVYIGPSETGLLATQSLDTTRYVSGA